ncbi:MAG: 30S ribosome-binding factor RbfA [Deltaproteobacteria bacterium]|nr:30S ribosome-binding factor RbfA [Deltaproteobacteria bacterium]
MSFKRADRVADLIKSEIADIILRQVGDPRVQHVTVTGVEVSSDLKTAKLYFVAMGEKTCGDETKEGLKKAAGFLRRELGKRLQLRYVPDLLFIYDSSFEYGDRIEKLLAEVREEQK